eukprot:m.124169 g.124169  ORF g.124169 m.124169 type:complete len:129 (+) comp13770_c0_seq1:269-655(+)
MNELQNLLDSAVLGTRQAKTGAIIRKKDSNIRALSPHFRITPSELSTIHRAFANPKQGRETPVLIHGKAYSCVRVDEHAIYAKDGDTGVIIVQTKSLIVLAEYDGTMFAAVCAEAVESLGSYLIAKGK